MKTVLSVNNLTKKIGRKQILKGISFTLNEGEILGFIGPNGAGKTTTIKTVLGLQTIDSGEVLINGYNVKDNFVKAIEKVGAIVESPDLYMYLSGRKNLELISSLYKNVPKEKIDEVVKLTGLENRIDDKVSKYSLGMRQRLGIAAALINNPNVLILDEPTNGLDPEGIKDLRTLIVNLAKKEKIAFLISSHNLAELESFCTDVCMIKSGEIIATSSIKELKVGKNSKYIFEVSSAKKVKNIIKEFEIIEEDKVSIMCDKEDIPKIIKKIIDVVDIYSITLEEISLEEAFLNRTGGNVID